MTPLIWAKLAGHVECEMMLSDTGAQASHQDMVSCVLTIMRLVSVVVYDVGRLRYDLDVFYVNMIKRVPQTLYPLMRPGAQTLYPLTRFDALPNFPGQAK